MSQMLFRPLRQIADKFNSLQMGMVAAERIFDILETENIIIENGNYIAKNIKGDINFKDLQFSYVPGETVLHKINLKIKAGETVAIVGSTGAGKSTIINLLSRLYEFDSGEITIDNRSIRSFNLKELRKHIGVVLQDVFLFADSLYNNITLLNNKISKTKVIDAAKNIGVHDFISSLPGGYDYDVKERGVCFLRTTSINSFFRAYISNPEILVLDEATSSIDTYSEEIIQKATEKITKGKTSIIIAHRLTTIKNANRIVLMENGRIVEEGTHKELIKINDSRYAKLYKVQFEEELLT